MKSCILFLFYFFLSDYNVLFFVGKKKKKEIGKFVLGRVKKVIERRA